MTPEATMHFGDVLAWIGVSEGPWWSKPVTMSVAGCPDAMLVRMHDGTLAYVAGHCKTRPTYGRILRRHNHGLASRLVEDYLRWTDDGFPITVAIHEHETDTLLWAPIGDVVATADPSNIDGEPMMFLDRSLFHAETGARARA